MTTGSKSLSVARDRAGAARAMSGSCLSLAALGLGLTLLLGACDSTNNPPTLQPQATQAETKDSEAQTIREGDVLHIAFPGAPTLDTTQTVRRDGRISLSVVGEIKASGLTPPELEKQLSQLFDSQLIEKEVTVTVVSSSFIVYVTGAVIRPGKVTADHPVTIVEAINEAGGFDTMKADMKHVKIVRTENGKVKTYIVNVKDILNSTQTEPIYLKPSDSVMVPERFSMFN
jgi:polysaccharide export outer membrane protein